MKALLVTLAVFGSLSVLATTDYERGFKAGVATCSSQKLVMCTVKYRHLLDSSYRDDFEWRSKSAYGETRTIAMERLVNLCQGDYCEDDIAEGKATCKGL